MKLEKKIYVGVEYAFGRRWSAKVNAMCAWWSNDSRHRYWRVSGASVEMRRWFGTNVDAFELKGHHMGAYMGAYRYDFELGDTGNMAHGQLLPTRSHIASRHLRP